MLVGATVEAALPNGLRVRVGQYFEGTIEEESLGRTVRDWQRAPELRRGAKIVARLLWAQPELKRLGLSLAPHLVACARYDPPAAAGTRRASSVDAVIAGGALLTTRPADDDAADGDGGDGGAAAGAFLPMGQVAELQRGQTAATALRKLKLGAPLAVVVTGVRWLDGRLEVSARRAAKPGADGEIYSYDAVTVGASLRGTILRLDDDGAKLRLGRDVSGRVPVLHLSDKPLARPQQRLKKGSRSIASCSSATLRRSSCDCRRRRSCWARRSHASRPTPTRRRASSRTESSSPSARAPSPSPSSAASSAVCVARRFAPRSALCGRRRRARATVRGRCVRCRVVRCDAPQRRLVLSFLTADQAAALPPSALAAALPAGAKPAGAALSLRVGGTTVDDGATVAAATADGLWVSLGDSSYGWLPYPHLTDSAAAAPVLWRDAASRCVGAPLPRCSC